VSGDVDLGAAEARFLVRSVGDASHGVTSRGSAIWTRTARRTSASGAGRSSTS
jgi:hypothetical protein